MERVAVSVIAEPPFYTLLRGIPWDTYENLTDALAEHRTRHTYDRGLLEIRRVLPGVAWHEYMGVLDALGGLSIRHTYLNGWLEFMSPLKDHDWIKKLLSRMIESMCWQLKISIQSVGSMTVYKESSAGGLQPDEAYYVQSERKVRCNKKYDPKKDPPPDLAIEVDVTCSSVDRLETYARIGVTEVWRHDGKDLHFLVLGRGGKYRSVKKSTAFAFLRPTDFQQFLEVAEEMEENEVIDKFFAHAQKLYSGQRNKT